MKKIIILIIAGFVGISALAQKTFGEMEFSRIDTTKEMKLFGVTGILGMVAPDSTINIKKEKYVTMFFSRFNVKTTVTKEFYISYLNFLIMMTEKRLQYTQYQSQYQSPGSGYGYYQGQNPIGGNHNPPININPEAY